MIRFTLSFTCRVGIALSDPMHTISYPLCVITQVSQNQLINDILKQELGFKGFVVSDWAGINEIDKDYKASIIKSINAGIDMVMVPGSLNPDHDSYDDFIRLAIESVKEGSIPMDRIDDAVTRILKIKKKIGLFDRALKDSKSTNVVGS